MNSRQPRDLTFTYCLEVSLLDPSPDSSHGAHGSLNLRSRAFHSLLKLLMRCTNLKELRLLDVQRLTDIFNPLEEMTRIWFQRFHSLEILTVVCGDLADWAE